MKLIIISGGQTGVDRAALEAAMEAGIPCGGWCPKGRRSEDGRIPDHFPLKETPGANYRERTIRNVRDSDGTLILATGAIKGGTRLTLTEAKRANKPVLVLDLADARHEDAQTWIREHRIHALNVAGPRESSSPGIYHTALIFLRSLIKCYTGGRT